MNSNATHTTETIITAIAIAWSVHRFLPFTKEMQPPCVSYLMLTLRLRAAYPDTKNRTARRTNKKRKNSFCIACLNINCLGYLTACFGGQGTIVL
jgi:hypothetical protein